MITLYKLSLFRVVYTTGSLNRAAQALYMSQSTVSQHIHSLEVAFGSALFTRSSKGVRPTAAGDLVYEYAGRLLGLLNEAERAVAQLDGLADRQLNVAATPGVSVYLLPLWLNTFRERHPSVSLNLQTALTHEITRDVLHGRYDLGFVEGDLNELDQDALGRLPIRSVEYFMVVSAAHPWRDRDRITLDDLSTQPFISRQSSSRSRKWFEARLGSSATRLHIVAELDSPGAIKYTLLNGLGVSVLADYVTERETERGELHRLRLEGHDLTRPLLMLWDKRQPFSAVQRAFVESLSALAPQVYTVL